MNDAMLLTAARHAYERGRVKKGVRRALLVLPFALVPLHACATAGRATLMLAVIAAVAALVVVFHWRGEDFARGANVGLIAGLAPLLLPFATSWIAPICSTVLCGFLPAASIAGGFVAALCLAGGTVARSRRDLLDERPRAGFWIAALSITLTLGIAGCLHIGLAGLAGLALGLAVGTLPVLAAYALKAR
ncbi:MAG TPA: hypothetical protein VFO89_00030 [Thermoanaerobaculia bacterium]|nr:hypothetical protein [Thermoanaerobaculia bacterium]